MQYLSVGDMARTYQMRRQHAGLQEHLARLSGELTTGVRSDLAAAVSGDFRALAGLDHSLATLRAFKTATDEAALFAQTLQTSLETAQSLAVDLAPGLLTAAMSGTPTLVDSTAQDARQKFDAAVAALNAQVAGRYLMSGTATDQKPILGADAILAALTTAIAGQTTASGVAAAVAAWFDAPAGGGGYLDTVYGGSTAPLAPVAIGPETTVTMDLTAADPEIRDLLEGFALGALVAEGALAGDRTGRALLLRYSGEALISAGDAMAGVRARVGTLEAHIADCAARNAAEASALEIARNGIIAADPFETATAIEGVQTQIETLYTLTARLSRLSLKDYLG